MATAPISYGNEYGTDYATIERNRKYAELLQQQALTPTDSNQTVSGWVIPTSPIQGLAKALQGVAGKYGEMKADEKEKALAAKYQTDLQSTLSDAQKAYIGSPAVPARSFQTPANEMGDEAATQTIPGKAAVAGDPMAYASILMRHPATQALGMTAAQTAMQRQQWAQLLGQPQGFGTPGALGTAPEGGAAPGPLGTSQGQAAPSALGAPQGGVAGFLQGTGITPQDAQAALLADPTGKLLTEKILAARAESNKPIALREGDLVRPGPDGQYRSVYTQPKMEAGMLPLRGPDGQVMGAAPIPGYGAGVASIKGAETGAVEGAKAPFDMVKIDTPQGPRMVTRAQALQMSGGPMQVPPQVQQQRDGDALRLLQDERAKATSPQDIAALDREIAARSRTAGIPLQSDEQKAYGQARAKDFASQASGMADQGNKAASMSRQLSELERLYQDPNITKGAAAESISGLKNLASSFGIDVKGLGGEQAVQAITNKMALDLRSTGEGGGMPGAMSDADRNFLANMTPNLSKSPDGRKKIIETTRKMAQRQMDIARMATAYEQKNGQIDVGFQKEVQDYANANPLFTSNATGVPQLSPEAQAIIRKYRGG